MARVASINSYRGSHYTVEFCDIQPGDLKYRNFKGAEKQYNAAGARNFSLVIDPLDVQQLRDIGMYVAQRQSNRPGDPDTYQIKVNVSYKFDSPMMVVTSGGYSDELDENTVGAIDDFEILEVPHLVINTAGNRFNDTEAAYISEMEVVKRSNPWRDRFRARASEPKNFEDVTDDDLPF